MFSVVLPVYNEEKNLKKNVKVLMDRLERLGIDYEIIIAEDGSTDRTYEIGLELSKKYDNVRFFHHPHRLGRGRALKMAFRRAEGNYVAYMDIDLATSLESLRDLINYLKNYDVVTGSRYMKKSMANRTLKRRLLSSVYNLLVRFVLNSKVHDHQCGFKGFKREVVLRLNKLSEFNHWFWDTEILVLAQRCGYRVKEFPVEWKESEETKVNTLRDALNMFLNLIILRMRIFKNRNLFELC